MLWLKPAPRKDGALRRRGGESGRQRRLEAPTGVGEIPWGGPAGGGGGVGPAQGTYVPGGGTQRRLGVAGGALGCMPKGRSGPCLFMAEHPVASPSAEESGQALGVELRS